ncbi:DEAD/DEAH box helicase (plasmid) [Novosphingobium sp. BL-8A]|uniref:DEAD/DEAH box helicase n=1 Tax=Novosphingobium sp. BL-8A TaxID=3127639 RepID=UPI003757BA02
MTNPSGLGEIVLILLDGLLTGDLLYLADDDQEAEAVAAALTALCSECHIVFVPSSDTLPGDRSSASPANIGRRVAALRELRRLAKDNKRPFLATITSGEAAARLYADPAAFDAAPPRLYHGHRIDAEGFAAEMEALGYVTDDRVDEPGEVAVRGNVIDIFPADAGLPARIDIAGGRIAGIRRYDPATQLTEEPCGTLEIGRAAEPASTGNATILAHLRAGRIYFSPHADKRRRRFIRLAREAAADGAAIDAASEDLWEQDVARWTLADDGVRQAKPVERFAQARSPIRALERFAAPLLDKGTRMLLVGAERDVRFLRTKLANAFNTEIEEIGSAWALTEKPPGTIATLIAPIDRGGVSDELILVAAADLLGSRALLDNAKESSAALLSRAAGDIRPGDLVVHEDHGMGRVVGLELAPGESAAEMIALEYAGGGRRLVPVQEAGLLWRYGGDGEAVKLDKLDGSSWEKRRLAIDEAIAESASQLLEFARERSELTAPLLKPEPAAYERFAGTFPFNETADQSRAIQAVREDLASGRPMDRLVVGDVGYGKTEVALRAAALAALAGYQVILAAPTTVLVRQHLQTFERRFAETGLKVVGLSRLSSAAEKKKAKAQLADGSARIVIGTAAVMGKDVHYARLGLVIIDEEQRFGAADKAKLRRHANIHLLAMSATPIPRTLHRAMIGLQQISVIATPPARRQPIRTSIASADDTMMRTALLRERSRGGQSFVVAPRIEDLAPLSERLARIVPDLTTIEAHGKMPADEIDEAMVGFGDGRGDILLATNIIEAGLDVPRANTMIVWQADRFGLGQLHQLRGRVGRGNRRGQVMLFTNGDEIAQRAMKRLRSLTTYDRLGAGFEISAADLDQRGAGDPLAETQSGHMKLIGVELYQHLFEAALKQARGEDPGLWLPELNLGDAGRFPEGWIPEPDIRLGLYVRLARISDDRELDSFEEELADRFGPLPAPAARLITCARIAILARVAEMERIDAGPAAIALTPRPGKKSAAHRFGLAQKNGRWLLKEQTDDENRLARVTSLLETLVLPGD